MLAAEAAFTTLLDNTESEPSMEEYWTGLKKSWVWEELYQARSYTRLIMASVL
mgnify:CR=1 FL=1